MRDTAQSCRRGGATPTMWRTTCALFALAVMSFRLTGVHAARLGNAATYETTSFKVEYGTDYKIVTTKAPSHAVPKTYVLYSGASQPTIASVPAGAAYFKTPVQKVATGLTIAMGYLEQLGLRDKLALVDPSSVHAPCIQRGEALGNIEGSHSEYPSYNSATQITTYGATWIASINNYNSANAASPITMNIVDDWGFGSTNTAIDVEFVASHTTLGMLQRTEQVKFLSLFFDLEAEAEAYYNDQVDRWNLQTRVMRQTRARGHIRSGVSCAWISVDAAYTWNGVNYPAAYKISWAQFKRDICEAAGMSIHIPAGATSSAGSYSYTSLSAFHTDMASIDIIIDESYAYSPSTYTTAAALAHLGFTTSMGLRALSRDTGRLLRLDKHVSDTNNGANGFAHTGQVEGMTWFEDSFVHPALVLQDLTRIVYWENVTGVEPIAPGCPKFFRDMNPLPNTDDGVVVVTGDSADECTLWDNARTQKTCLAKELEQRQTIEGLFLSADTSDTRSMTVTVAASVSAAVVAIVACLFFKYRDTRRNAAYIPDTIYYK
jgi:hypothetical protein